MNKQLSEEPNQTEAEKVLEKYFPNPDDLVNGRVKSVIVKAMEEYGSLARKYFNMIVINYKGYTIKYDPTLNAYICSLDHSLHDTVISAFAWIDYITK